MVLFVQANPVQLAHLDVTVKDWNKKMSDVIATKWRTAKRRGKKDFLLVKSLAQILLRCVQIKHGIH